MHARERADAKAKQREQKTGITDMFAAVEADVQELSIDDIVKVQKELASTELRKMLASAGPLKFSAIWAVLLKPFMLRVTNVKDICVELAKRGVIRNSWGGGNRKPKDEDPVELVAAKLPPKRDPPF